MSVQLKSLDGQVEEFKKNIEKVHPGINEQIAKMPIKEAARFLSREFDLPDPNQATLHKWIYESNYLIKKRLYAYNAMHKFNRYRKRRIIHGISYKPEYLEKININRFKGYVVQIEGLKAGTTCTITWNPPNTPTINKPFEKRLLFKIANDDDTANFLIAKDSLGSRNVRICVEHLRYLYKTIEITLQNYVTTIRIEQELDLNYANPV